MNSAEVDASGVEAFEPEELQHVNGAVRDLPGSTLAGWWSRDRRPRRRPPGCRWRWTRRASPGSLVGPASWARSPARWRDPGRRSGWAFTVRAGSARRRGLTAPPGGGAAGGPPSWDWTG